MVPPLPALTPVLMMTLFIWDLLLTHSATGADDLAAGLDAGSDLLHGDGSYPLPLPMWLPALTAVLMVIFMGSS